MKKIVLMLVLAVALLLPYNVQAGFGDGGLWGECAIGMNAIVVPAFQYQPTLKFAAGLDRVLLDAQFGINQALSVDSTLLQTVGVGVKFHVWSGGIPFVKAEGNVLHVLAIGTARSVSGEQKIDFKTGDIGMAIRPDFKPGNKVMPEARVTWLYGEGALSRVAFGADVVFEF